MVHASPQFTPGQLIESGRRAEAEGRLDLAVQFYRHLIQHFAEAVEAAEAHGSLCGALCAQAPLRFETWLEELLPDADDDVRVDGEEPDIQRHVSVLQSVFSQTSEHLGGDSMQFAPLLPDDEEPLSGRTSALAHWCEGFLYGLGASGLTSIKALPGEVGGGIGHALIASVVADEAVSVDACSLATSVSTSYVATISSRWFRMTESHRTSPYSSVSRGVICFAVSTTRISSPGDTGVRNRRFSRP